MTISLIDNITHLVFDFSLKLKQEIIKSYVSDHFPVFVSLDSLSKIHKENVAITTHKRVMHGTILTAFKTDLRNINWNSINHYSEANSKHEAIFKTFSELYKKHFPIKVFQIKAKDLQTPWRSKD